jgi:hypothetical protein
MNIPVFGHWLKRLFGRATPANGGTHSGEPTGEELSFCLDAVASQPAEKLAAAGLALERVVATEVAQASRLRSGDQTVYYLDFVDPRTVAPGQVYTTWVVTREAQGSVRVDFFCSRVREDGRGADTIPPREVQGGGGAP